MVPKEIGKKGWAALLSAALITTTIGPECSQAIAQTRTPAGNHVPIGNADGFHLFSPAPPAFGMLAEHFLNNTTLGRTVLTQDILWSSLIQRNERNLQNSLAPIWEQLPRAERLPKQLLERLTAIDALPDEAEQRKAIVELIQTVDQGALADAFSETSKVVVPIVEAKVAAAEAGLRSASSLADLNLFLAQTRDLSAYSKTVRQSFENVNTAARKLLLEQLGGSIRPDIFNEAPPSKDALVHPKMEATEPVHAAKQILGAAPRTGLQPSPVSDPLFSRERIFDPHFIRKERERAAAQPTIAFDLNGTLGDYGLFGHDFVLRPDISSQLQELRKAGFRLVLWTRTGRRGVRRIFAEHPALESAFDLVISAENFASPDRQELAQAYPGREEGVGSRFYRAYPGAKDAALLGYTLIVDDNPALESLTRGSPGPGGPTLAYRIAAFAPGSTDKEQMASLANRLQNMIHSSRNASATISGGAGNPTQETLFAATPPTAEFLKKLAAEKPQLVVLVGDGLISDGAKQPASPDLGAYVEALARSGIETIALADGPLLSAPSHIGAMDRLSLWSNNQKSALLVADRSSNAVLIQDSRGRRYQIQARQPVFNADVGAYVQGLRAEYETYRWLRSLMDLGLPLFIIRFCRWIRHMINGFLPQNAVGPRTIVLLPGSQEFDRTNNPPHASLLKVSLEGGVDLPSEGPYTWAGGENSVRDIMEAIRNVENAPRLTSPKDIQTAYVNYTLANFDTLFPLYPASPRQHLQELKDFLSQGPVQKFNAQQLQLLLGKFLGRLKSQLPTNSIADTEWRDFILDNGRFIQESLEGPPELTDSLLETFRILGDDALARARRELLLVLLEPSSKDVQQDFARRFAQHFVQDIVEVYRLLSEKWELLDTEAVARLLDDLETRKAPLKAAYSQQLPTLCAELLHRHPSPELAFRLLSLAARFVPDSQERALGALASGFYQEYGMAGLNYLAQVYAKRSDPSFHAFASWLLQEVLVSHPNIPSALTALREGLGEARFSLLESILLGRLRERPDSVDARVLREWRKRSPSLAETFLGTLWDSWQTAQAAPSRTITAEILWHQYEIEAILRKRLQHIQEMNAPPAPWDKAPRPWAAYIEQLPPSIRRQFTLELLNKQGSSTDRITSVIENLEPGDGVREAVAQFLAASPFMNSNRSDFSQEQIQRMFAGDRFQRFFPWIFPTQPEGAVRTKFILAVRTSVQAAPINIGWLQEKINDEAVQVGVPQAIGFRPALTYNRLGRQLNADFRGNEYGRPPSQLRGLIVQGGYDRAGYSMFMRLAERGDATVENDADEVAGRIESNLRGGVLSRERPLLRRLFVYNWALNAGDSLIDNIRNQAIRIAAIDSGFWTLRVEIHNFPNMHILQRVRSYRAGPRIDQREAESLDRLIADIERFLSIQDQGERQILSVIEGLRASDESKADLKAMAQAFDGLAAEERLSSLAALRARFHEIKSRSRSDRHVTENYLGDRDFSQMALSVAMKEAGKAPALDAAGVGRFLGLSNRILDHMVLDDFIAATQRDALLREAEGIRNDPALSLQKKWGLLIQLYENAVDQVYFNLEREFGKYDGLVYNLVRRPEGMPAPPRFLDTLMRSHNVFALSSLVDKMRVAVLESEHRVHKIGGQDLRFPVEVYNPGTAVGVLRMDKSPLELTKEDIGFFLEPPVEISPAAGLITVRYGARLSHLQLLARSLGIPNVRMRLSQESMDVLKKFDDTSIRLAAFKDGHIEMEKVGAAPKARRRGRLRRRAIDKGTARPVSFEELASLGYPAVTGSKGMMLARLFNDPALRSHASDGVIVPFAFFEKYAEAAGLAPWIQALGKTIPSNTFLISFIAGKIRTLIRQTPLSAPMQAQLLESLRALQARTGNTRGYFVRSNADFEDLPDFNGAGINVSAANVPLEPAAMEGGLREQVWSSFFLERSLLWGALAAGGNRIYPSHISAVITPTTPSKSSGVILSRGAEGGAKGRGAISANWGIGSVVSENQPVEEIDLEGAPHRFSFTTATQKKTPNASGGLESQEAPPGVPVLSEEEIRRLNELAVDIDARFGEEGGSGSDIEWAVLADGHSVIHQVRPVPKH